MAEFQMPSLGADMEEGTVLEWLVKPGDIVHKGDIVAVVDTAKAAVEVETFTEGTIDKLLVDVGTRVPVGTPLALIGAGQGAAAAPAEAPPAATSPAATPPAARPHEAATPLVKKVARELGIDLAEVAGTGPHGRITREDVQRAAAPPAEPPRAEALPVIRVQPPSAPSTRVHATPRARHLAEELGVDLEALAATLPADEMVRAPDVRRAAAAVQPEAPAAVERPGRAAAQDAMRQAIARLMARSKREIPHYYLTETVDLSRALAWMRDRNRVLPVTGRLLPAALLLKATAVAARKHRELNGFWVDDAFAAGSGVHLGVAVSLRGGGLVAPALHDADTLDLGELMARMRDLVSRARAGRLRGSEMSDPTLTVTNLGDQGVESVLGVIYPPQVALVGFGKVVERPWASDGMLGVRPVTTLTLAADHRATDGFTGARFLTTIDELLQRPEEL